MLREVLDALDVQPGGRYVDCTLGGGGHAEAILERAQPGGTLLGIDADPAAIERGRERLARFGEQRSGSCRATSATSATICRAAGVRAGERRADGPRALVGPAGRRSAGFSFQRRDAAGHALRRRGLTASDIVNTYGEAELADLIFRYGEDPASRRIARRIVASRPIRTTAELAKAVEQAVGRRANLKTHPATRTFQALRIAVNQELDISGRRTSSGPRPARLWIPPRRAQLPLARGPHREGVHPPRVARLHLPAGTAGVPLRPQGDAAAGHARRAEAVAERGRREPARRSARLRAAERIIAAAA